jgi:hypothetical protein
VKVALVAKGYGWWNYRKDTFDEVWAIGSQFFHMGDDCTTVIDMHNYEWTYEDILEHARLMNAEVPALILENEALVVSTLMPVRIKAINKRKLPVVSVKQYDFIPTSIEYPREAIIRMCNGRDFFTCGVSYAIAYAAFQNALLLNLYGIGAMDNYADQHPSIAWICGIAEVLGTTINIDRSGGSQLLLSKASYGYAI